MSERISKLILETEFKTTGDLSPSVAKIDELRASTKAAQGDVLKLVESEKKLEQAAAQAGVSVETQTKKQTEFAKTLTGAGKALNDLSTTKKLEQAFSGGEKIADVNKLLKEFEKAARSAKSVDELEAALGRLMDALPEDERLEIGKILDSELGKLAKSFDVPLARMKELRRLANTTDDPELMKLYTEEAGKLKNELDDTNNLIKALSSSSFFTDTLVEGAQTAVSAFTAFQGALGLVTEDQEELARVSQKAQSALALLQGTQTLLNELKKSDNIITRSQIAWQKLYAVAVGNSTGAMKLFRQALLFTGIGALIAGIALLAANWDKVKNAVTNTTAAQRINQEIAKKQTEIYAEEAASLEIARAKLASGNITQEERVAIIKDLQNTYPSYLKNINAETVGYEELDAALRKVGDALLIKAGIQAREEQLVQLQKQLIELERLGVEGATSTGEAITSFIGAAALASTVGIEEAFGAADAALQGRYDKQRRELKDNIDFLIKGVLDETKKLDQLGGDPTATTARAAKSSAENKKLLEGTIAFFEARVAQLAKVLNEDLVAGSEQFFNTKDEWIKATKELQEARKLLETPEAVELFTEGSLNALNKQADELRKIISNLPKGDELAQKAEELRAVNERIKELQAIIDGPQTDEGKLDALESLNFDLLNEEERHQLAMLQIEQRGEEARLKTQLTYAKERLRILQESGKATEAELEQAKNAVIELEAELDQSRSNFQNNFVQGVVDGFKIIVDAAFQATQQIIALKQQEIEQLTALQEQRVADARNIADKGNAEILQAEEERLAKLQEQGRNYARQQIALTQLQITAQSALAIAKAAAQGGVAAPFTIAATLIALAAGYAQARAQASSVGAGFKKGGYTGDGDPSHVSTNQGFRGYTYHKGEYIMPAEVTGLGNNRKWFEKIRTQRIDVETLVGAKRPVVVVNNDHKDVVKAINDKPVSHFSFDKNGIVRVMESNRSVENKRQSIKKRGKK